VRTSLALSHDVAYFADDAGMVTAPGVQNAKTTSAVKSSPAVSGLPLYVGTDDSTPALGGIQVFFGHRGQLHRRPLADRRRNPELVPVGGTASGFD
jgi:hypothetical protein